MPFEINLPNRLLNVVKKGDLTGTGALNFNSIAVYTVTSDVDGLISVTYDEPYPVDSTFLLDWTSTPIDITGMTSEEQQEAFTPVSVFVTEITNEGFSLSVITRGEITALGADGVTTIPVNSPILDYVADKTLDIVVIEIAA
jgi:hypothetical protein